ncbi:hypothetical protein SAMN02746041_00128 [Desulfacinum hydrothermale DSM 13146]|uniref:Uncharacterized protein n=1 Tax=Desulfacinum hydrothermale DSM 13146 TaxID=1121390 RepID=A0A1W1WYA5_9BACT|nr:hypothetical protein [Desulfacinum hydrothermale]SMC16645.1 hypothetical protein SAMN02746041_00128 [Desulfacinum hydrothermale DSM 13146]
MCLHQKRTCACGREEAFLFHRDNVLPEEVLLALYCPVCAREVDFDASTMIRDAGWILEYDMEAARFYLARRTSMARVSPEVIFDGDYCSWYGLTPRDLEESARLNRELEPLRKRDLRRYIEEMRLRRSRRVEELKAHGWRKALR